MKIELENSDVKELLMDSFINGGLSELQYCDCLIDWDNQENNDNYEKAKALLKEAQEKGTFKGACGSDTICSEDVLMKMLEEFGIVWKDYNESFKVGDEYSDNMKLTIDMAKENLQKTLDDDEKGWFLGEVKKIIPEYDDADAYTYFHVLQGALFGEVIYG